MLDKVIKDNNTEELFYEAIERFGVKWQVIKLMEENGEFLQALAKYYQYTSSPGFDAEKASELLHNLKVERVDIEVMLRQMDIVFNLEEKDLIPIFDTQIEKLEKYLEQ